MVVLFIAIYWFYELAPLGLTQSRLDAETDAQQVTSVERGYNLYEANCARCHGANGEGGIGPVLNSQEKLFAHLSVDYLNNMMIVGGRYACGNPNSLMPVWSNEGHPPGPLNYIQIEDLIAFIRAPSTETFTKRDPALNEPLTDPLTGKVETFNGWLDPNYKPAPGATPFPACWSDAFADAVRLAERSDRGLGRRERAAASRSWRSGVAFTTPTITAPADKAFVIDFDNEDAGTPHNIQIKDSTGAVKFKGATFPGVATQPYHGAGSRGRDVPVHLHRAPDR